MFRHLVLGLLRDGQPRHGYELTIEHNRRTGVSVSTGNFYRELQRLAGDGLIEAQTNPPDADTRRIPYQITETGRREFDKWLVAPCAHDADLCERLLFSDRVPREVMNRIIDWWQEELWMRTKTLARAREEALRQSENRRGYNPLPLLLARRMKLLAAELEFINDFRMELDSWDPLPEEPKQEQPREADRNEPERLRPRRMRGSARR